MKQKLKNNDERKESEQIFTFKSLITNSLEIIIRSSESLLDGFLDLFP